MGESIKSKFKPSFPQKYQGDPNNIICRSSWERRFCNYCDTNPNILRWASEEFSIPYVSPVDNRVHRYYPDSKTPPQYHLFVLQCSKASVLLFLRCGLFLSLRPFPGGKHLQSFPPFFFPQKKVIYL